MRTHRLGGMESAVYPYDCPPLCRQGLGLCFREPFRMGQLLRDGFIMVQLPDIFWRGDDEHELGTTLFSLANLYQPDPVGGCRQLPEIGFCLGIGGQLVVVADVEAEMLFGTGNAL